MSVGIYLKPDGITVFLTDYITVVEVGLVNDVSNHTSFNLHQERTKNVEICIRAIF